MRVTSKVVLVCLIAFCLFSCGPKQFESEKSLWEYLKKEDNGYLQKKQIRGVDYSLVYKPTDLLVKQHLGDDHSKEEVEKWREHYGQYLYFNLSMSKNGRELLTNVVGDRQQFGQMVNTLSFNMQEKVFLVNAAKDTLTMADFVYPRLYGMSGSTDLMFVFTKDEKVTSKSLKFSIKDLGFFTGEVNFKFDPQLIENQPSLKFK